MISSAVLATFVGSVGTNIASDLVVAGAQSTVKLAKSLLQRPSDAFSAVLRATHDAYVATITQMAKRFVALASSSEDRIAATSLEGLTRRPDFRNFRTDAEQIPIAELDGMIDDLFGANDLSAAKHADIALADLRDWGVETPPAMIALFERGTTDMMPWCDQFRANFLAEMVRHPAAYQAFSMALLGEIRTLGRSEELAISTLRADISALDIRWSMASRDILDTLCTLLGRSVPDPALCGLTSLAASELHAEGFKAFLNSAVLPYFSREAFDRSRSDTATRRAPAAARNWFTGPHGENHAVLILGPGGVGKTRLATEICRSHVQDGWQAWYVERHATVTSIADHFAALPRDTKTILLIDYGESATNLAQLSSLIRVLTEERRVRLVVTCRASAGQAVRDLLIDLHPSEHSIGLRSDGVERDYAAWVVKRILDHAQVPDADQVFSVCDNLPVLAAFAAFLQESHPTLFDEQFRALLGLRDFNDWVARRLSRLPDPLSGAADDGLLAQVFAALPIPQAVLRKHCRLHPALNTVLDRMVADRWIEPQGTVYSAAHDVFADAIVARYIFAMPGIEADRIAHLLQDAIDPTSDSAVIALDRLALGPMFDEVDDRAIVDQLLTDDAAIGRFGEKLLNGRLLAMPTKLDVLISAASALPSKSLTGPLDYTVSRLAEWVADQNPQPHNIAEVRRVLTPMLEDAIGRSQFTNIILRRAYEFDPARYAARALASVRAFPHADQSHFLLTAMIKREEVAAYLQPDVVEWLEHNAGRFSASFVLHAWLPRTADVGPYERYVLYWLREYGRDFDACWMIQTALRHGIRSATLWPSLRDWLKQ